MMGNDTASLPDPLDCDRLRRRCQLDRSPSEDDHEPDPAFGQDRAMEAVALARSVEHPGYNLFVMGPYGARAQELVRKRLEADAASSEPPSDWVYVNNFDNPMKPVAIELPRGRAEELRKRMASLIEDLSASLPAVFESEDYRRRRESVEEDIQSRQETTFEDLNEKAQEKGVAILRTPMGFAVAPMRDGEVVQPDEFRKWPEEEREETQKIIHEIQEELQEVMRQQPAVEKERREAVRKLDRETAEMVVGEQIDEIAKEFEDIPRVQEYLEAVRKTLVENARLFLGSENQESGDQLQPGRGVSGSTNRDGRFQAFTVNTIVAGDADTPGAPVTFEDHPTMMNLIGRVEHVSHQGALLTNFTLIRPGALHRANGGYLLLDVRQLLSEPFSWQALKRALRAGSIRISSPQEYLGIAATVSLEPDPIPLDIKVVLFGERIHYYLMLALDPDLRDLFKVVADFEEIEDWSEANDRDLAALLTGICRREGLRELDRSGAEAMVEHAARLADDADKLSLDIERLADRLREADHYSGAEGNDRIHRADVEQALTAERRRIGRLRDRIQESILRDLALIDVEGTAVGQINGLSVSQIGDLRVGRPNRITARVRVGSGEVVDIEREAKLGGPIHSKGVLVLSGFLAARYALDAPMSLWATLVFEQSYGGVEGDSASCAELCALLSALSEIPLRQDIAITGSVNQHGRVQAIGGVNDKIEGFFDICSARGLTGSQGVLIPDSNVQHLMLREDVVEACRDGRFAVHAVRTVDEAVTLLSGREAGERGPDGAFPEGSVNAGAEAALRRFARSRRSFVAHPEASEGEENGQ